jgi:hypothetical protein
MKPSNATRVEGSFGVRIEGTIFYLIEDLKKSAIYRQLPEVCLQNSGDVTLQDNAIIDGNEANLHIKHLTCEQAE